VIMGYIHVESVTWTSPSVLLIAEVVLKYDNWHYVGLSRHYPHANYFRRMDLCLCERGSAGSTSLVNGIWPSTVRIPAKDDVIIAAVRRKMCQCWWDTARELGILCLRALEVLREVQLNPYRYLQGRPSVFRMIVFYRQLMYMYM
jgi:hypothetical protein